MSVTSDTSDITNTWFLVWPAARGHMFSLFGMRVETKKREESVRKEIFQLCWLHVSSWTNGGGVQGGVSDKQEEF